MHFSRAVQFETAAALCLLGCALLGCAAPQASPWQATTVNEAPVPAPSESSAPAADSEPPRTSRREKKGLRPWFRGADDPRTKATRYWGLQYSWRY